MSNNWRETLFVWDGILSSSDKVKKEGDEVSNIELKWEGSWVGCHSADAVKVDTPKRGAFDREIASAYSFTSSGTASAKDPDTNFHLVSMNESCYDLGEGNEKETHFDDEHSVYLSLLRWTGNIHNQVDNLVFALGSNEYGKFISVGWLRVGNRITLARRYLEDSDMRCKWDINALKDAVLDEISTAKEGARVMLRIPPWQCSAMHSEAREPSAKRRKQSPQ